MGGRGSSSASLRANGISREIEARDAIRAAGFDPNSQIPYGEYGKRVRDISGEISNWAYSGGSKPNIEKISQKTREQLIAKENEDYARSAKSLASGRWVADTKRGISAAEAEKRNEAEWQKRKQAHEKALRLLGDTNSKNSKSLKAMNKNLNQRSSKTSKATSEKYNQYYRNAREAGFSKAESKKIAEGSVRQYKKLVAKGTNNPRNITSTTYERAQKRLDKEVASWVGRR